MEMKMKNRISNKLLGLILILCTLRACQGQLMCYVCDSCAEVNAETPQFECNEDFFNNGAATGSSVQTTTEHSTTAAGVATDKDTTTTDGTTPTPSTVNTEETASTTASTTTSTAESKLPESTSKASTETTTETITETSTLIEIETTPETTSTTEEQPPTPPTQGPPRTTTPLPTPPTPGSLTPLDDIDSLNNRTGTQDQHVNKDEVENVDVQNGTAKPYKPSTEFRVRQLRSVSDVSFHCFKVKATAVNGTMVVNRGCSRVQTSESVCGQWETEHPNEKMNKCYPCSRTKCNGSSALSVSITALFVALVAVLMHRN